MYLRKLELKDAKNMFEWMHDDSVVHNLQTDYKRMKLIECNEFIQLSNVQPDSKHYAIASDTDEYMGTVSLKKIDLNTKSAELDIIVRRIAMGRGYSWYGMVEILKKAFNEFGLECVYWCVSRENGRAVRFYDKHNFHEAVDIPQVVLNRYRNMTNLKWYSVLKGDVLEDRDTVVGCKVIHVKTIPTVNAGELSFFEGIHDIPFDIKRMYYISKVPEGVRRGFHAHKNLKQLLFCPYGRIQLILDDGNRREEVELSDPSIGVVIDKPIWREMLWMEKNSVLCVAASEYYDVEDYIRDYEEFKTYVGVVG